MFIFLSSFKPNEFSDVEIQKNQAEYLKSFEIWKNKFEINDDYYYIDNTINSISDIVNLDLLKVCWDLQEFGAVRPFVHIERKEYKIDPDLGSIQLFRKIFSSPFFLTDDVVIIILGKRSCNNYQEKKLKSWLNRNDSNCFYLDSDEIFAARSSVYADLEQLLKSWSGLNYNKMLEYLFYSCR